MKTEYTGICPTCNGTGHDKEKDMPCHSWGLILAIRTGSADFSHQVLAVRWVQLGYNSVDGHLTANGRRVPIREEVDLFSRLRMDWIEPEKRNYP